MDVLYIISKRLTWGFQIYYLLREIFKFCDFMDNNIFQGDHESVDKIEKFQYFGKVVTNSKSQDQVLQNYM